MIGPEPIGGIVADLLAGAAFRAMAARIGAIPPSAPREMREALAAEAMWPIARAHAAGIRLGERH